MGDPEKTAETVAVRPLQSPVYQRLSERHHFPDDASGSHGLPESRPAEHGDWILAVLFAAALAGESVADQQQWDFHQWKAAERRAGRTPRPDFLQTGLFRFSRHPNFFFEQAQWWLFYGFAVAATGNWFHWTVLGAVLLTLLFAGSTVFTESISRARHPGYLQYQQRTSPIIPLPPRRRTRPVEAG